MHIVLGVFSIVIVCVIIIGLMLYFLDMFISLIRSRGVPYVASFDKDLSLMHTGLGLEPGKTILDLGCGDGKALRYLVKQYKLKSGTGYEISWNAWVCGKYINWRNAIKNVSIIHTSFYQADIKKYDYVYCYLMPFVMGKVESRLQQSIEPDTIIISNTFAFPHRKPYKTIKNAKGKDTIFLYKK